jgi:hypothetical protein
MAQVSFLIANLPMRDSWLQISSCPKQKDLAVRPLFEQEKKVTGCDSSASYLQTASLTGTRSLNPKVHHSVGIHVQD